MTEITPPHRQWRCVLCKAEFLPPIPHGCTRCAGPLERLADGWDGVDIENGPRNVHVKSVGSLLNQDLPSRLAGDRMAEICGVKGIADQLVIGMSGLPSYGKSTLAVHVAEDRTWDRPLLVSGEEKFGSSVVDRLRRCEAKRISICDARSVPEIMGTLHEGDYDLVVIDSVTSLHLNIGDVRSMARSYPAVSFVCVVQSTKDGGHRGAQEWIHDSDIWITFPKPGVWLVDKNWHGEIGRTGRIWEDLSNIKIDDGKHEGDVHAESIK